MTHGGDLGAGNLIGGCNLSGQGGLAAPPPYPRPFHGHQATALTLLHNCQMLEGVVSRRASKFRNVYASLSPGASCIKNTAGSSRQTALG